MFKLPGKINIVFFLLYHYFLTKGLKRKSNTKFIPRYLELSWVYSISAKNISGVLHIRPNSHVEPCLHDPACQQNHYTDTKAFWIQVAKFQTFPEIVHMFKV